MSTPSKDDIKDWLKKSDHDRDWLGEQVGVNRRTVDNWLSSPQVIPVSKLMLIQRLMEDTAALEEQRKQQMHPTNQVFSLEVDLPRFRAYNYASLAAGLTLEEWAIQCCDEEAKLNPQTVKRDEANAAERQDSPIIAEDSDEYGAERHG
jgi:hypothetical protein